MQSEAANGVPTGEV